MTNMGSLQRTLYKSIQNEKLELMAYWNPLFLKQAVRCRNKCTLVQNDVLASLK